MGESFELHELYIAGHFIEAGVAHFEATRMRTLLDVVCKLADLIERTFGTGPGQIPGYCGHEEIELALLKLARATGEPRYSRLAAYFIHQRGAEPNYFEAESKRLGLAKLPVYFYHDRWAYLQAAEPVRQLAEPVGHAVRMMYLGTAMATSRANSATTHCDEPVKPCGRDSARGISTSPAVWGRTGWAKSFPKPTICRMIAPTLRLARESD